MLKIPGTSALSDFRIKKLLTELEALKLNITAISACFIHFVDIEGNLDNLQADTLSQLLIYGSSLWNSS